MCFQLTEGTLIALRKQRYLPPRCQASFTRRRFRFYDNTRTFASSVTKAPRQRPEQETQLGTQERVNGSLLVGSLDPSNTHPLAPQNIAILGGGVTGLASAYYLSKEIPSANITLYESTERLGGWLNSNHVNVGNGKIVFEQGPRTLRPSPPAARVTIDLIRKLGLEDEVLTADKSSVGARNRFIYYPDHLVQIPNAGESFYSMMYTLLSEKLFRDLLPGLGGEFQRSAEGRNPDDESVGSFLERRLGSTYFADNIISALLHGIYAGDIYQLSINSLSPYPRFLEERYGSVSAGIFELWSNNSRILPSSDARLLKEFGRPRDIIPALSSASVFSFKRGIGQLSDALVDSLKSNPRVRLITGEAVKKVVLDKNDDKLEISTKSQHPTKFNQVISTISGRTLSDLTENPIDLPSLQDIHAVTVMVVNLYYTNPSLLPVHGFGYLIPRSVPWDQNPERALGVVFDSDTLAGQDTVAGTKVTVMLGGHWWDDFDSYPDEDEGAVMAKAILKRHLKIEEEPAIINVSLQKDCIPQYTVGHDARMKKAHSELKKTFQGKLAVAGNSYTGVGLNDCVRAAWDVVKAIKTQEASGVTGLESFKEEKKLSMILQS